MTVTDPYGFDRVATRYMWLPDYFFLLLIYFFFLLKPHFILDQDFRCISCQEINPQKILVAVYYVSLPVDDLCSISAKLKDLFMSIWHWALAPKTFCLWLHKFLPFRHLLFIVCPIYTHNIWQFISDTYFSFITSWKQRLVRLNFLEKRMACTAHDYHHILVWYLLNI